MTLSADQFLTWLLLYGYPVLFGAVLAGSLGVPIPNNLLILAAGGFAAEGELDLVAVLAVVLVAAVIGDCVVFGAAWWLGEHAVVRHGARVGLTESRLAAARRRFGAGIGLGVFVTRWLLTPLSLPAGVLAGVGRYPPAAFVACAVAGEVLWTALFVGLGYLFGDSWSGIMEIVQDSFGVLVGVALAAGAIAMLWLVRSQRSWRQAGTSS
jgi:membrane protein DedA with SNARE-associated domain